jgi:hypothetical protein
MQGIALLHFGTRYYIECVVYRTTVSQEYLSGRKRDGSLSICFLCPHSVAITMSTPHVFPVDHRPVTTVLSRRIVC